MAKAKKRRHSKKGFTIPLAALAGFIPLANQAVLGWREGGIVRVGDRVTASLTGYDPATQKWNSGHLVHGPVPIMLGILTHKVASKLGVNRMLASAGVPWLRI